MTFTFDVSAGFTNDKDRVRFHTGDIDPNAAKWSDELILAVIAEVGSYKQAVIALLTDLLLKLAQPDFKADWLEVSNQKAAADTIRALLTAKKKELGVGGITSTFINVYRSDSLLTGSPTYINTSEEITD